MSERPVKRKYESATRRAAAEATRERICAAAEACFVRDGYARTSVRAVAAAAGVAEATVYLAFRDKPALLDAVILRATRDNASEPLDAIAAAPPDEVLRRLAASNAVLMRRAARLIALGESASLMDSALRPLRERAHRRLRAGPQESADALYALSGEGTYLRMTEGAGLPAERYADWLADTLEAVLLRPTARTGSPSASRSRPR